MLRGRRCSPAERDYVEERAEALRALARSLEHAGTDDIPRTHVVAALQELEQSTGTGSVAAMAQLRRSLEVDG